MKKIGRNDPCPCGSGKKYKLCCAHQDFSGAANTRSLEDLLTAKLRLAIEHHQEGRIAQAESLYQQILDVAPGYADALNLTGLIAYQRGQMDRAVTLIAQAIHAKPLDQSYHYNLGVVQQAQGRLEEAVACYRQALLIKPDYIEVYPNLGVALHSQNRLEEAVACYRQALSIKPDYAEAYSNLGLALKDQGQLEAAVACYRQALLIKPDYAEAYSNLGLALRAQAMDFSEDARNDYDEWIRCYDTLTDEIRIAMKTRLLGFAHKPLISVVMSVYNSKPEWLIKAIESVRKQIYPHWELCIADNASSDPTLHPILERYAKQDARIKVVFREQNGHIAAASNSALELAVGEWVALLEHDDLLAEHALFWVAEAINQNTDARLIYSDEDKIDGTDRRFAPDFKCDWDVDFFYSHNLITHLGIYSAELLKQMGGFRPGFEGAQDYDLALRCIEHIATNQIHHIPRVLYHWRMHPESTVPPVAAKPYAVQAGVRALNEHYQRRKISAQAELMHHGYRVHYTLPEKPPLVSLIIPTRNGLQLIRQCVDSILEKTTYPNYEILIVDNGSDDSATLQYLSNLAANSRVTIIRDDSPFNYSALNNAAVKLAQGEVLGLLNNDLEVISPEWLFEMVSIALQPQVGAVGAKLWYPNNTLQHGGVIVGIGGVAGHAHKHLSQGRCNEVSRANLIQGLSAVTAACLVIRKATYEKVGGLNDTDLHIAFNDVDFCLRVRAAGYRNIWTPYAELYHHESATRGYEDTPEKQARFYKEIQYMKHCWGETLLKDPFYSPNLTVDYEDFSLAWPPRV
ncbi:MAG: glycosyltransferase [Sulfuriferula sp.]